MIDVTCPGCGKSFKAPDDAAGRKGRCKACGSIVAIPNHDEPNEKFTETIQGVDLSTWVPRPPDNSNRVPPDAYPDAVPNVAGPIEGVSVEPEYGFRWEYKMVPMAPIVRVGEYANKGLAAAAYLEGVVRQGAVQGWEFFRVDSVAASSEPGCLSAIFGAKTEIVHYHVVTFRRRTTWEA